MASIIQARDFSPITTDPMRDRWTVAKMAAVVEALDGAEVIVETEQQTGHAWPLRLERVSYYHPAGSVLGYDGNNPVGCWYPLYKVGVICDTRAGGSAKWDALKIYRDAEYARKLAEAERSA